MSRLLKLTSFCVLALVLVAVPAPAKADWWPPTKWFHSDPKEDAIEEVCDLAEEALDPLNKEHYEEFVANFIEPCADFHKGQPETVAAGTVSKIFRHRAEIGADLRRVSPKTLRISDDLNTATIASVQEGFYMNFVKHEGKWVISSRMQNLQLQPPVRPTAAPAPAAAEETAKSHDDNVKPVEPKTAAKPGVVFKTAASVREK
jgi:hypothetical protein